VGYTQEYLEHVGGEIAADDDALNEARARLTLVRGVAANYPGALRTYRSGSLAHHTVTNPVSDADGGVVLNRQIYTALGPDGSNESPLEIVEDLRKSLGEAVRGTYPKATVTTSKRGPLVSFNQPLPDGQDPTVDLVVALNRRNAVGLWIPNLEDDCWDASDPEGHADLLADGGTSLVATRRKVIRLLKAWNKKWSQPTTFSFHLAVLALEYVPAGVSLAEAFCRVFEGAAADFDAEKATPDPAGVSPDLVPKVDYKVAGQRMRAAGAALRDALSNDGDRAHVAGALAGLFPDDLTPWWVASKNSLTSALAMGSVTTSMLGVAGATKPLVPTRAFGARRS
jgi:hypothetical protein